MRAVAHDYEHGLRDDEDKAYSQMQEAVKFDRYLMLLRSSTK